MKCQVGVFESGDDAIAAVRRLEELGYEKKDISVLSRNPALREIAGSEQKSKRTPYGKAGGAVTGSLVGGLGALLIELGLIAIPGIGPVLAVGPIGAALVGGLTGGAVGGVVGALIDMGFDEEEAHYYNDMVRQGKILVLVEEQDYCRIDVDNLFSDEVLPRSDAEVE